MQYKLIKVCGLRDADNTRQVAALGVDWIGMIFYPKSPRFVGSAPPPPDDPSGHRPKRVGVFVDEMAQTIVTHAVNYRLDLIQLHGHESPTLIRNLRRTLDPDIRPGVKFVKAVSVGSRADIAQWEQYADCVDYLLFDTKCKTVGGSGEQFDWDVLQAYDGPLSFLLSGGIGPGDAERLKRFHHPQCVGLDLNSRFESAPGVKDVALLSQFVAQIRQTTANP